MAAPLLMWIYYIVIIHNCQELPNYVYDSISVGWLSFLFVCVTTQPGMNSVRSTKYGMVVDTFEGEHF